MSGVIDFHGRVADYDGVSVLWEMLAPEGLGAG